MQMNMTKDQESLECIMNFQKLIFVEQTTVVNLTNILTNQQNY